MEIDDTRITLTALPSMEDAEYTEELPDDNESEDDRIRQNNISIKGSPSSIGSRRHVLHKLDRGRSHSAGPVNKGIIRSASQNSKGNNRLRRNNSRRGRSQTSAGQRRRQASKSLICTPKSPGNMISSSSQTSAGQRRRQASKSLICTPKSPGNMISSSSQTSAGQRRRQASKSPIRIPQPPGNMSLSSNQQTVSLAKERSRRERARTTIRRDVASSKSNGLEILATRARKGVSRTKSDSLSAKLISNANANAGSMSLASDIQSTTSSYDATRRRSSKKTSRGSGDSELQNSFTATMFKQETKQEKQQQMQPVRVEQDKKSSRSWKKSSSLSSIDISVSDDDDIDSQANGSEKMKRPNSKKGRRFSWWALDMPNDTDSSPIIPVPPQRRHATATKSTAKNVRASIHKHFQRNGKRSSQDCDDHKSTATGSAGSASKQSTLPTDLENGSWSRSSSPAKSRSKDRSQSPHTHSTCTDPTSITSHLQRQGQDGSNADDLRSTGTRTITRDSGSGVYSSGSSTNKYRERRGKRPTRRSIKKHLTQTKQCDRGSLKNDDLRSTTNGSTGKPSVGSASKQSANSDDASLAGTASNQSKKNTRMSIKKTLELLKPTMIASPKRPSSEKDDLFSITSEFMSNEFNPDDASKGPESVRGMFHGEDSFQILDGDNHHRMTSWRKEQDQKQKKKKKKKKKEKNAAANIQVRSKNSMRKSMKQKRVHHSAVMAEEIPEPFLLSPHQRSTSLGDPFAFASARDWVSGSANFDDDGFGDFEAFHQSVAF
jgi:hypothetical protein